MDLALRIAKHGIDEIGESARPGLRALYHLIRGSAVLLRGSQTHGIRQNDDGSYDIYFGPKAPTGFENNWLETVPGKSWFVILRMYGPLKPWIEKQWRPREIEVVK